MKPSVCVFTAALLAASVFAHADAGGTVYHHAAATKLVSGYAYSVADAFDPKKKAVVVVLSDTQIDAAAFNAAQDRKEAIDHFLLWQPDGKATTVTVMIGADKNSGSTYYEVACQGGSGFVLQASAQGAFQQAIECAKAQGIGGGCELTVIDETAEAGTYSQLAKTAGFECDVAKYRFLGTTKDKAELVELACKNRADGGLAMFPASGKGQVFDCVQGGSLGVSCQLSQPNANSRF